MRKTTAAALAVFLLIATAGAFTGALEWDEGSFLLNAEYFQGTGDNWEKSRPAALSYMIAGVWAVTGEHTAAARMLVVLFGAAGILIFSCIARHEFGDDRLLTAVFALTPLLLYWSFHTYTDVPGLFFILSGLYLYRRDRHLLAGVMLAFAATVRYLFFLFAAGMAVGYLIDLYRDCNAWRAPFLRFAAGGLIGALPFFLYSTIMHGSPFARIVLYVTQVSEWSDSGLFAETVANAKSLVIMLSTLLPAAALGWRESLSVEKGMVLVYTGFMLLFAGMSFDRYWLPLVPLLLLMVYRGVDKRWFLIAVGGMLLVSGGFMVHHHQEVQLCAEPFDDALDYVKNQEGPVVSDRWAITGYTLERTVYAPYTDYDTLHTEKGVKWAVTTEELPYQAAQSFSNLCKTYRVYDLSQPAE